MQFKVRVQDEDFNHLTGTVTLTGEVCNFIETENVRRNLRALFYLVVPSDWGCSDVEVWDCTDEEVNICPNPPLDEVKFINAAMKIGSAYEEAERMVASQAKLFSGHNVQLVYITHKIYADFFQRVVSEILLDHEISRQEYYDWAERPPHINDESTRWVLGE